MKNILMFLLLISIIACGQITTKNSEAKNTETNEEWKTFDQSKYSIKYPSSWELNQSSETGANFMLFSPQESEQDNFKENINLLIQDFTGQNVTLDTYIQNTEDQIKTMLPNSTLIENKRNKNKNGEYQKLVYSGDQESFHLTFVQYVWIINEKAYLITFTSEQNKYADFKAIGEKIMDSFCIKK